jgi:uncharacterized protein YkwD
LPALEAVVFADVEPTEAAWLGPVPGEDLAPISAQEGAGTPAEAADVLLRMLNGARENSGILPLSRDRALDAIAARHARSMRRTRHLAHNTGDGDPAERASRMGVTVSTIGENLSHASSAVVAHRALWFSPSHRINLLDARFERVGIGAERDDDGSLWIVELFASRG